MSDETTHPENTRPTDPIPRFAKVELADGGFTSPAGHIYNLKHGGCSGSVSVLLCNAGTTRGNHYHREDSHWLFVVSGKVDYYERAVGNTERPLPQSFGPGEMFYTPPMREHVSYFPVDTVLVSISDRTRTHEEHEKDLVRVKIL